MVRKEYKIKIMLCALKSKRQPIDNATRTISNGTQRLKRGRPETPNYRCDWSRNQ